MALSLPHTAAAVARRSVRPLPKYVGFLFLTILSCCNALDIAQGSTFLLQSGPCRVELDAGGGVRRIEWHGQPLSTSALGNHAGVVQYAGVETALDRPNVADRVGENACRFVYRVPNSPQLEVAVLYRLVPGKRKSVVLHRQVVLEAKGPLAEETTVKLPIVPALTDETWVPHENGTRGTLGAMPAAAYHLAGKTPGEGVRLAIPVVSNLTGIKGIRATLAADPYFSTLFTRDGAAWTYPKQIGLEGGREERSVVLVLHEGGETETLQAFFDEILGDVPPGPSWLHEIALVGFDYMSDGGKGWYADIDALEKAIAPQDRRHVFLCMHAWYDWLGKYCLDEKTGKFVDRWTAFGNYEKHKNQPKTLNLAGDKVDGGFTKCVPVELTPSKVLDRLKYAKSKGFRVGMYFADGMIAGTDLPSFDKRFVLHMGGWQGPDTPGQPYCQNPLVPEVRRFYLTYADALLDTFASQVDAFVWDETFSVPRGSLGSEDVPGYADRAMMRLVRDVAKRVENFNQEHHRQIALLTSDCLGTVPGAAPYALAGHGTYQDTWCQPKAWSYAVFPNYRNTVWSCCWWPVHKWRWIDFGARHYQAPVAVSNGWGDNQGFSELTPEMQQKVIALFQWRKRQQTNLKAFDELPVFP